MNPTPEQQANHLKPMTALSDLPDHIRLPLCAVIEPDEIGYRVNPKFVKWLTIARFKYERPDEIKQLADYLAKAKMYDQGMTLKLEPSGIRRATLMYSIYCQSNVICRIVPLISDYLTTCDLHYHDIAIESLGHCVYELKFTFT